MLALIKEILWLTVNLFDAQSSEIFWTVLSKSSH